MYADECTTRMERISYARLLVEMDVTIPLPNSIKVMDTQGKVFEEQIWYDWRPQQCATCCLIGHDCKKDQQPQDKTQRPEVQKKEVARADPKKFTKNG